MLTAKTLSNKPMPPEVKEAIIVFATGWTLDYIKTLSLEDFERMYGFSHVYLRVKKSQIENISNIRM